MFDLIQKTLSQLGVKFLKLFICCDLGTSVHAGNFFENAVILFKIPITL